MEVLSILNESDHAEIARIIQYNRQIRQMIQDQTKEFLILKNNLMENLHNQQIDENPIVQNSGTFFDTKQIEFLNEQVTSSTIQLALVGTNSCGKTSFLHFLLRSGNFLPIDVGPISARIIRLTYADVDNAALYVYSSLSDKQIHEQISLKEFFYNRKEPDWNGMKTAIQDHVKRPDSENIKPDSEAFAKWAEFFVEIRIPSSFLKLGIDIYDTPGLLFSDAPILKNNLCQLVKLVKPTLVFMYDNASISLDAKDCFLAVKDAIGQLADVSMFFLNTKADIDRILADVDPNHLGIDDEQLLKILSDERQTRYKLLLNVQSITSEFPGGLPKSINECCFFDILSIHSDSDDIGAQLNQTTINRLIQFTANADLKIARKVSRLVLPMIDAFFDLVLTTNHRSILQFRNIHLEALQWTENYYDTYSQLIEKLVTELYNNIHRQIDNDIDNIAQRVARYKSNIPVEDYINRVIQQDIIKPHIKSIRQKYTNSILLDKLTDVSLLNIAQKNEFLIAAQRHSNWLFESEINRLDKKSTRQIFAEQTVLAQILLITDILVESNDRDKQATSLSNYRKLLIRKSSLGKDASSFELAKERIVEISIWFENQKPYINETIKTCYYVEKHGLIEKINQFHHLAEKSLGQRDRLYKVVQKYTESFASIQCKIVSVLNLAKSSGKIPNIDSFQMLEEDIYIDKKDFIIKKTSDYLEVHYHLRMIQLTIPNILPLVNLYEDEKTKILWMFFPNYFQKLNETNLTIDNIFEISFDLADTLAYLHFHEIVHGNLRIENIFLDQNNQCYLANFHFDRKHRLEIHDDIYAFGQLGKFLYDRITHSDMNISGEDFVDLEQLESLFIKCTDPDIGNRPTARILMIMTENLKKILETNHQIKHRIQRLTNEFQNFQIDFIKELQDVPKTNLEDEYDFKNFSLGLQHQFNFDKIQLTVCGPNSSGKTAFIHNFLQIGAILPARVGPVTARIVKLTYASASKACLNVYSSINAGLNQESIDLHLNLSQFFTNKTNPDWAGIRNEISIHLERPNHLSDDEFTNWAKCFVELQIPSSILELGIDIYDTPGFLFHDKLIIKENLFELARLVKPVLIFMYENCSVDNDAHECFLALQLTLENLEESSIFFLNTKQDIKILFDSAGINISQKHLFTQEKFDEIFPQEREKRLKLLLNHPIMRNYLYRNELIVENFDIYSLPIPRSILPQCATSMAESAVLRIIEFATRRDLQRPYAIVKKILNSIDSFFQFSLTTSHRNADQWKKIRQDAQAWGISFFNKFQQEMSVRNDTAYNNILLYFDQCSANICERAIRRDRLNDPLKTKTTQITEFSIKQFIQIAVQEEVIKVAVNEIINLTKEALRLSITREIAIQSDHNELLLAAKKQALIDISATELEQRTWFENVLLNLSMMPMTISRIVKGIRIRLDVEYWNQTTLEDFQTVEEYIAYSEALDSHELLINPDKRKDFAEDYLKKMKIHIKQQETLFKRNLKDWIENRKEIFFENIQSNYHLAMRYLSARKLAYEKTKLFTGQFARIQCQLLAIEHAQKFHEQIPIIDTSIILGHGAFFNIYPGEWGKEKDLAVKKLKQPCSDQPNLQYLEAYYHQKITKLVIPHIVPLLYLYTNPKDENDLWIFLPRYKQSLGDYLKVNIQTIKVDQVIKMALDIAHVILKLHSYEIVHRDLKSKNILLDENDQCHLADFGTCKETSWNSTIVGTYPLPPELFLNRNNSTLNYNGMAMDIFSFGILLYELLPKQEYNRPYYTHNNIDVKELLKRVTPFDINNNEYELLIESCLAKEVEHRPTALEVVQKLEAIKKILEQKLCSTCDTHARQCRYYPCGHKLLCQICHDKLKRNNQNQVQCILCRKIVQNWQEDEHDQTFFFKP